MKKDLIFVEHILESIENIENFVKWVSKENFEENKEKQSALIRQIEIIGEAAKNISPRTKKEGEGIGWREIIDTRDKMIHNYFGVDLDIVWDIVKIDIPKLKNQMISLRKKVND